MGNEGIRSCSYCIPAEKELDSLSCLDYIIITDVLETKHAKRQSRNQPEENARKSLGGTMQRPPRSFSPPYVGGFLSLEEDSRPQRPPGPRGRQYRPDHLGRPPCQLLRLLWLRARLWLSPVRPSWWAAQSRKKRFPVAHCRKWTGRGSGSNQSVPRGRSAWRAIRCIS